MCLDNVFVTVFLFCFSLLPMAYLRYYPFRIIATSREQHTLIVGHLIIFVVEFLLVTALFLSGRVEMGEAPSKNSTSSATGRTSCC